MKYLKALWFWIYFPIVTFVIFSCIAIYRFTFGLFSFTRPVDQIARAGSGIWARWILYLMPGWHVEVTGKENLPPKTQTIILAANHSSAADIWATYFVGVEFCWFAKDAVFKVPMVGQAMRWGKYIPVVRGNKSSHQLSMRLAAERVREGINVFFFPEGTRSETGELRDFKIGAFKTSAQEKVPILPIAIVGAKDLVRKGSTLPGVATVKIKIMPLEWHKPDETIEQYASRVRTLIVHAMESLGGVSHPL